MTRRIRPPIVRLLTVPEAATHLGLSAPDLDELADAGEIAAVRVSAHGGRRFWPRDVDAFAFGRSTTSPAPLAPAVAALPTDDRSADRPELTMINADGPIDRTAIPQLGHRPARSGRLLDRPHWLPFERSAVRAPSAYLAFKDAEHLQRYIRLRTDLVSPPDAS
ncbi:MAG: helix-turn-helix domain-containing protein [Chloroflexi bacterium]|nr:helix-turn-helix domain-containing protein [Chloroflexota bacterium]